MWIEIKKDIFDDLKDFKSLNFLLQLLTWRPPDSIDRYNLFVELGTISQLDSYKRLDKFDREVLEEAYNNYTISGGVVSYCVTRNNKKPGRFNLEESIRFFMQPASIILENSKNDALFIEAIVEHFEEKTASGQKVVKEHIRNGWIQFENAGGCGNVKNFIEGKLQAFNNLALKNQRPNYHYLRCMVILDSDKKYPAQPLKQDYLELKKYLKGIGINNYHILEKRSMENYVPDEVVSDLKSKVNIPWVKAYGHLSAVQRDFLSYNAGFTVDEHMNMALSPGEKNLYPLSQASLGILHKGIGYAKFKDAFPKLFNHFLVNKQTLKARAGSDELATILDKIKSLI